MLTEEALKELVLPGEGQILGVVTQMLGYDRLKVKCTDGNERLCRIRGKMKRRVWIKTADIVLVEPWGFQSEQRGDILWRYTGSQADSLRRRGYLNL